MDINQNYLERDQDPLIKNFKQIALEVAERYTPKYVQNMKFELNLDKPKKSVIIDILIHNF